MLMSKSIHTYTAILLILFIVSFSSIVTAKMFIITHVVSGQVVSITADNAIELDDGHLYYPDKKTAAPLIQPKTVITIKYYMDNNLERKYIEYAPGKNSLNPTPEPNEIKPRHKL